MYSMPGEHSARFTDLAEQLLEQVTDPDMQAGLCNYLTEHLVDATFDSFATLVGCIFTIERGLLDRGLAFDHTLLRVISKGRTAFPDQSAEIGQGILRLMLEQFEADAVGQQVALQALFQWVSDFPEIVRTESVTVCQLLLACFGHEDPQIVCWAFWCIDDILDGSFACQFDWPSLLDAAFECLARHDDDIGRIGNLTLAHFYSQGIIGVDRNFALNDLLGRAEFCSANGLGIYFLHFLAVCAGDLSTSISTRQSAQIAGTLEQVDETLQTYAAQVIVTMYQRDPLHYGQFIEAALNVIAEELRANTCDERLLFQVIHRFLRHLQVAAATLCRPLYQCWVRRTMGEEGPDYFSLRFICWALRFDAENVPDREVLMGWLVDRYRWEPLNSQASGILAEGLLCFLGRVDDTDRKSVV
jgi:hypothetical protein